MEIFETENSSEQNGNGTSRTSRVGRHLPTSGGLARTLEKAEEQGCEAFQIFVSNPQGWADAAPRPDAEPFREGVRRLGMSPVVVHAKYLINLAAADGTKQRRSIESLAWETLAAGALGAEFVVVHSGSHGGDGLEAGEERFVRGFRAARDLAEERTAEAREIFGYENLVPAEAVVENSCNAGTQLAGDTDSMKRILDFAEARCCLDTAHAFVSGYDLSGETPARNFASEVGEKLGGRVAVVHLNDARNELGSRRDGHERLGEGRVPLASWEAFLRGMKGVPLVMETPYGTPEEDVGQVRLAKKLAGGLRMAYGGI